MKKTQFQESKKWFKSVDNLTLDDLLGEISVQEIDEETASQNNSECMIGWFGVVTDAGIVAYFGDEAEALGYRLNYINRLLNS